MTKFNVIDLAPELMLNMAYIQLPDTPVQKARHVKCMLIPYGKSERFKVAVESSVMEGDAKGPDFEDVSNAECGRPESPEGVIHGWEDQQAAREAPSVCEGIAYNAGR